MPKMTLNDFIRAAVVGNKNALVTGLQCNLSSNSRRELEVQFFFQEASKLSGQLVDVDNPQTIIGLSAKYSALDLTIIFGRTECVKLLIEQGAKTNLLISAKLDMVDGRVYTISNRLTFQPNYYFVKNNLDHPGDAGTLSNISILDLAILYFKTKILDVLIDTLSIKELNDIIFRGSHYLTATNGSSFRSFTYLDLLTITAAINLELATVAFKAYVKTLNKQDNKISATCKALAAIIVQHPANKRVDFMKQTLAQMTETHGSELINHLTKSLLSIIVSALFDPKAKGDPQPCLEYLLSLGLDLKFKSTATGDSLLHFAVRYCCAHPEYHRLVSWLISQGLDANCTNNINNTPLHESLSVEVSSTAVNAVLLEAGANLELTNTDGKKPTDLCRNHMIVKTLLEGRANYKKPPVSSEPATKKSQANKWSLSSFVRTRTEAYTAYEQVKSLFDKVPELNLRAVQPTAKKSERTLVMS